MQVTTVQDFRNEKTEITYKTEQNKVFGDWRVNAYIGDSLEYQWDGNWSKTKAQGVMNRKAKLNIAPF